MLSAKFDTSIGHKRQEQSYREISLTLGVEHPSQILFVTDILEEAQAAQAAGLRAVISVRDGNGELPAKHGFTERSEEHTSELQSLMRISYAVFCLKKQKQIQS